MKKLLAMSGLFVITSAITLLVVRARRRNAACAAERTREEEEGRILPLREDEQELPEFKGEHRITALDAAHCEEDTHFVGSVHAPLEAGDEASADESAGRAFHSEHEQQTEETRSVVEEAYVATEAGALPSVGETSQAGDEPRTMAEQESDRLAGDNAKFEAEEAHVATAEEAPQRPEEAAPIGNIPITTAEQESGRRRAGDEARPEAEEMPRTDDARRTLAQEESERQAKDEVRSGAGETHVTTVEAPESTRVEASLTTALPRESHPRDANTAPRGTEEAPQLDETPRAAAPHARERAEDTSTVDDNQGMAEEVFHAGEESRIPGGQTEARRETTEEVRRLLPEQVHPAAAGAAHNGIQEQCAGASGDSQRDCAPDLHADTGVSCNPEEGALGAAEAKGCLDPASDSDGPPVLGPSPVLAKSPRQYRPVAKVPAVSPVARPRASTPAEREARDRSLTLGVRLIFEQGGFCRVSLLPRRGPGMLPQVAITGSGDPPELVELQEDWYQDMILPEMGHLLRHGVEWVGGLTDGQQVRWSLGGREIYVLAPHEELAGFVSVPRMILGEQHVVLCTPEKLEDVRTAVALANSSEPELLENDNGVPAGWVGLRGVIPRTPVPPSASGDILNALRPLPEVAILLEGGIRIDRQTWLSGYPPHIRLRGDTAAIEGVLIDGREASLSENGGFVVPGWDTLGDHTIWCTAGSRTYSIREGAEEWEPWDAYRWSQGDPVATGVDAHPAICGVLVRAPRSASVASRAIEVPVSNPVLIGAIPGEIFVCTPRRDIRTDLCVGFPAFEPVWAIPADALHCDKRSQRILLIGEPHAVLSVRRSPSRNRGAQGSRVAEWCAAIRMAGQKGLQTEPPQTDIADLWREYKQLAKTLWRGMR